MKTTRKMLAEIRSAAGRIPTLALALALALACAAAISASAAGAQSYRGSIRGTVYDQTRAVIPGAMVTVQERDTGRTRTATSGEDGSYVVTELPAGEYRVKADLKGLKSYGSFAIVQVGAETPLDLVMYPESSNINIEVSAAAVPIVETTEDVLGGVVEQSLSTTRPTASISISPPRPFRRIRTT